MRLAYVPNYHDAPIPPLPTHTRLARLWRGEVERCDVVMVHPRCNQASAIERAYALRGVKVEPWNTPKETPQTQQTVLIDGAWSGKDVVIVAGGPSLRGFDWARLLDSGCKVIAINRAYETVINPDLVYGMDNQFFTWALSGKFGDTSTEQWNAIQCPIIASTIAPVKSDKVTTVNRTKDKNSASLRDGVYCGGNSGMGALHLCSLLGVRRAYLLGYDCTPTQSGRTEHFHDGYKDGQRSEVYRGFIDSFNEMASYLNSKMEIINCNPDSGIKCFPFGDLPDGPLSVSADDIPPIICYVTPTYKQVFDTNLRPGVERYGLAHDLIQKKSTGNWKKNAAQKASIIASERRNRPECGLIWLDADSSLERLPVLFAAYQVRGVDFAAYTLPSGELLSSVLYFGSSEKATALLQEWERRCKAAPEKYGTADQKHLQDAVEALGIIPEPLPASYCKIFDHKDQRHITHPAIVQHQASRTHRGKK